MKLEYVLRNIATRIAYALADAKTYVDQKFSTLGVFHTIQAGNVEINASSNMDVFKLTPGHNIELTGNTVNKSATIAANLSVLSYNLSETSIPTDTMSAENAVSLGTFDVPPGVWMCSATVRFDANSTGNRMMMLFNSSGTAVGIQYNDIRPACAGRNTYLKIVGTLVNNGSSNVPYEIKVGQGSGVSLPAVGRVQLIGTTKA